MAADNLTTKVRFGEYHIPALEAGDYYLTVKQNLTVTGATADNKYPTALDFSVQGERFHLNPTEVHSVFPPAGGLGEYANVLPHIIIKRTTLPWERHAVEILPTDSKEVKQTKKKTPWLALLMFREDELEILPPTNMDTLLAADPGLLKAREKFSADQLKQEALNGYIFDLKYLSTENPDQKNLSDISKGWTGLNLERGQPGTDKASVIFVKKSKLKTILPSFAELHLLVHTRQGMNADEKLTGEEMSVVMGSRLPKSGGPSIMHLVSLEHRYKNENFDYGTTGADDLIPLVSLKSWRFSSLSKKHTFRGLLLHLNQTQLFRFATSENTGLKSNSKAVPKPLRDLLAANGIALGTEAVVSDFTHHEIVLKDYHFVIGREGDVYNEAGLRLFPASDFTSIAEVPKGLIEKGFPIPEPTVPRESPTPYCWITDSKNQYFIRELNGFMAVSRLAKDHTPTLRLPDTDNQLADGYLNQGYVPFPHYLRQGSKSVSWFRGPLSTTDWPKMDHNIDLFSVLVADELARYHEDTGMIDVTYAAAWELGRLLALHSKSFSLGLNRWKRSHARQVVEAEHVMSHPHLPFTGSPDAKEAVLPKILENWFDKIWDLEGIPYNYLVPDERMLPAESIRYFALDNFWMDCLIHGAFSIGQGSGTDRHGTDKATHPLNNHVDTKKYLTGFLLRSQVVSGWPGLEVEGFSKVNDPSSKLTLLRRKLSPNMLLCLFDGELAQVDFHLKKEVLHFGFYQEKDNGPYLKSPRNTLGDEIEAVIDLADKGILPRPDSVGYDGILNITKLTTEIKSKINYTEPFNSAAFALSMIEGGDRVRFLK